MKCHISGLTGPQWAYCVLCALIGLVANAILKCVPDKIFPKMGDETEEEVRVSKLDYDMLRGIASSNKAK